MILILFFNSVFLYKEKTYFIFFIINNVFFIAYEEPNLEKRFGDEYRKYKSNVPRWVPRTKPYKPSNEQS